MEQKKKGRHRSAAKVQNVQTGAKVSAEVAENMVCQSLATEEDVGCRSAEEDLESRSAEEDLESRSAEEDLGCQSTTDVVNLGCQLSTAEEVADPVTLFSTSLSKDVYPAGKYFHNS